MLPPLVTDLAINDAIDRACQSMDEQSNKNCGDWKLRRATEADLRGAAAAAAKSEDDSLICVSAVRNALLYGIVASHNTVDDHENGGGALKKHVLATFYLAYSTWDGRNLYLDQCSCCSAGHYKDDDPAITAPMVAPLLYQALAQTAVQLHCARFTWQHYSGYNIPDIPPPETLGKDWLTLYWNADAIQDFLAKQGIDTTLLSQDQCTTQIESATDIRDVFSKCLSGRKHQKFILRLATAKDVDTIGRLVQGLADFDKEPDAVNVTVELYRRDGFEAKKPLFHCLLLEHHDSDDADDHDNQSAPYTCGMALCYVGYRCSGGIFLYLEDLFIEEAFRGKGAGTFIMKLLASIGHSLGCCRLVWQAMDWNAPALAFYMGLGANVQEGLRTTRFAGDALKQFGTPLTSTGSCFLAQRAPGL